MEEMRTIVRFSFGTNGTRQKSGRDVPGKTNGGMEIPKQRAKQPLTLDTPDREVGDEQERTSRGEKTNAQHAALRRLPEHAEDDHYGL